MSTSPLLVSAAADMPLATPKALFSFIVYEVAPTNESHGPMGGADTRTF